MAFCHFPLQQILVAGNFLAADQECSLGPVRRQDVEDLRRIRIGRAIFKRQIHPKRRVLSGRGQHVQEKRYGNHGEDTEADHSGAHGHFPNGKYD